MAIASVGENPRPQPVLPYAKTKFNSLLRRRQLLRCPREEHPASPSLTRTTATCARLRKRHHQPKENITHRPQPQPRGTIQGRLNQGVLSYSIRRSRMPCVFKSWLESMRSDATSIVEKRKRALPSSTSSSQPSAGTPHHRSGTEGVYRFKSANRQYLYRTNGKE